jgi:rod shape-determining protein MreB
MFSAFKPVVYVQISPERLSLKNLKTGQTLAEVPELALSAPPRRRVLAVGSEARAAAASASAEVVNPFAHPRSMVSDFTVAELLLQHQLRRVLVPSLLTVAPCVIVHPRGSPAGGFTQVERRAFREMARGAGASEVFVWTGRPLTDEEARSRRPPEAGGGEWE